MNIDAIKNSESASFKKRNPHIFGPTAPPDPENKLKVALDGLKEIPASRLPKKKRIRQSEKPEMNRLESEWFARLPLLHGVRPQAIKFRIGRNAFYKPDFFSPSLMTAWEVKGLKGKNIDRGKLALKVAASAWPEIKFILAWKDEAGQWQEQHVLP